ncbi:PREDICTED: uncharacterized protein LOC109221159 [Nicotiana attenuata]|uniref:uncharacterized protein LOC109221159 n=1 Tax=Nicotiana attenuata TaxID=49451 RepID=UPI0009057426|nr:PREDICTED: uncharacterized protein LOC109221159 [Nicotiana attenuata]
MQAFERVITTDRQNQFDFMPKQQMRIVDQHRRRLGVEQVVVNVSNKVWVFIDQNYDFDILFNMEQQITLRMTDTDDHKKFIITMVYAKCDAIERIELWDTLYSLASDMTLPWLVGGDFNVIWDDEEKFGGLPVHINEIDDFRHCTNTCNLFDLDFKGSIFTWWNGRAEEDCIFKRLDRCLGNMELQQLWPGLEINHLSKIGSDHSPMHLTYNPSSTCIKKTFRFLNFWIKHESFLDVVKENWATFGDIFQWIASLEEVVKVHDTQFELSPTVQNRERLHKVQADLNRVWALEEEFWKQKSRMAWFKDEDRNTKMFHDHVNGKRRKLQLKRIQDRHGNWLENPADMAEEANCELTRLPTIEEVKKAVFCLNGDSAGGPDGFNGNFFHACWEIIGEDIHEMVKAFFCGQELLNL